MTKRTRGYLSLLGVLALAAAQGCGDDDNDNQRPPVINPSAGTGGKGNDNDGGTKSDAGDTTGPEGGKVGTGGKSANGGSGNGAGKGSVDPSGGDGQGGDGPTPTECGLPERGEDGCYNCPKDGEVEQWFNRCVDSDCEPFDNGRLPLLESDGSLPPLPT